MEFLDSSLLIYLGVHPNSSLQFLFASFYSSGCYCKLLFKITKAIIIIDHAHTDQTLKTASTYSKHCKRWVGHRTAPREHVQRILGCRRGGGRVSIYVQPFIASLHRAKSLHLAKFPGQASETFILVS